MSLLAAAFIVLATLPTDVIEAAKEAYNAGQYQKAARLFQAACVADPRDIELYRQLARARVYAGDPEGAVVAYDLYLAHAGESEDRDKIDAERKLAARKLPEGAEPPSVPADAKGALEAARHRAKDGYFAGDDGAFSAIAAAIDAGFIGPALADVRQGVAEALLAQSAAALDRWWSPETIASPATLKRLAEGWAILSQKGTLTAGESQLATTTRGLRALAEGEDDAAISAFAEIAAIDPRLRYAQAIALTRLGRFDEARDALLAVMPSLADPRVHLLYGLLPGEQAKRRSALKQGLGF